MMQKGVSKKKTLTIKQSAIDLGSSLVLVGLGLSMLILTWLVRLDKNINTSFDDNDNVVIINPTKYMIDPVELLANEDYSHAFNENPYEI